MSLTSEQQAIRSTAIGGSEIAAVVGLNPWMRPIDVWERKVGVAPTTNTGHTRRGQYLESGLLEWYRDELIARRGNTVMVERGRTMRHPTAARVVATPDGLVYDGKTLDRVVEIKSPGWRTQEHWGEPGTDQIPLYYVPQVTWEMAVAGAPRADVWVLMGDESALYTVDYDAALFGELADAAVRFWRDHVETKRPPPPDGSDSYSEHLARRFPRPERAELLTATLEDESLASEYREAREASKRAELQEKELRQRLETRIGEAEGLTGAGWKILYRAQKGRAVVDAKAIAAEAPDLVAKHTREGAPFRVFRPTFAKETT